MNEVVTTAAADHTPPSPNGVADLINNSANVGRTATTTIVSEGLSRGLEAAGRRALGTAAGAVVEPAVWVLSGRAPHSGDVALWGMGTVLSAAAGAVGSVASAATGLIKAAVEDHEDRLIERARQHEPERYRPFITSVRHYGGWAGRTIEAQAIASRGGTAWRVAPSVWVYITDALGRLVCDYEPAFAFEICTPAMPLRIGGRDSGGNRYMVRRRPGSRIS